MKKTLTTLAAALMLAAPAWAVDEHHPEQQAGAAAQSPEKAVERMQENATKMQVQLDRIAKAGTPEERQKLLMEHMQTMRENMMLGQQVAMGSGMNCPMMGMMGGGMGGMMGGGMMGGGMMGPGGAGPDPQAMMNRMQQMERRMDMMQMMMERQMGAPGKPAPQSR